MRTRITSGRLIDPAAGIDHIADLVIEHGRIAIAQASDVNDKSVRTIDASNCTVMAGGIDLHTHIGGGKVSIARMLLSDEVASHAAAAQTLAAECEYLPAAHVTGRRYLDMGYTTCFEPAVIPCNARSAHAEMADVGGLDTGGYCLLGNDDVLLSMIADKVPQPLINDYVAWMVSATQCIAVKVVNPGGINAFKFNVRTFDVDSRHPKYDISPGDVIRTLCRSVHEIGLRHPLHVHCSNLGVPGNIESTLATIEAANGLPIHLTHAQFHCYGTEGPYKMSSAAARLVEAMQRHPNVTIDVGQVMFGQTVTISADAMHQHENFRHASPKQSALVDVECEAGCGVVPFKYRRRQFVHSLQWAIGLELFLLIDDPSRVFLTTDHPNGAPFTTYPHLIGLLGDRTMRETALAEIHRDAAASSELAGLDRQYTIPEITTMTRSAPAAILGLADRGNLQVGSIADVVVYANHENIERMFSKPKYVFRQGKLVRGEGATHVSASPTTLKANLDCDRDAVSGFIDRYQSSAMMDMRRLWISDDEMANVIRSTPTAASTKERVQ
ncbi:formylmethanofuran dehydrogenase subunit A [Rubripirellula reticaptiva]|uniref:Formyltransferase/hydrolase complex Fhc subunit A n=1 Tax=Rubripirellula reticaptiva TaxID=2528013 RepID=A0A5C6EJ17_9BACT|nr:formylmethanofuran dehydrogenase subunit A [Rubripirellula reticaptiva]TWU49743.1 Formyltransferase/hydrolase complex Fhc subunit A [Rubripirellula reticaptiva]